MKAFYSYIVSHEWPTYLFVFVAVLAGLFINLMIG